MKELKSIFGVLLLLVGGFVLYKVLPAYWGDFKLGRMLDDQAIVYTYTTKSDEEIATAISREGAGYRCPTLAGAGHGAAHARRSVDHGRVLGPRGYADLSAGFELQDRQQESQRHEVTETAKMKPEKSGLAFSRLLIRGSLVPRL